MRQISPTSIRRGPKNCLCLVTFEKALNVISTQKQIGHRSEDAVAEEWMNARDGLGGVECRSAWRDAMDCQRGLRGW